MTFFFFLRKFISVNNLKENSHECLFNYRFNYYNYSTGFNGFYCYNERQKTTGTLRNNKA